MQDRERDEPPISPKSEGGSSIRTQATLRRAGTVHAWIRRLREPSAGLDHALAIACSVVWMLVAPARFAPENVIDFGFTYTYTQIADASIATGRYSGTLAGASSHNYESPRISDEVQREPMYPAALIAVRKLGGSYIDVLPFQRIALGIALYLWGVFAARQFGRLVMAGMFVMEIYAPAPGFYASVIYPYAFQFLFMTCAMLTAIQGLRTRAWYWFLLSGIAQGLACYERGAYLFLPLALGTAMFALLPRDRRGAWRYGAMAAAAALVVAPWLVRSSRLGQTGMNGMLGYALGFSYAHLPSSQDTPFIQEYDESVRKRGNDAGTISFMARVADRENVSLSEIDHRMVGVLLDKMVHNPWGVFKVLAINVATLPCRLTGVDNSRFISTQYDRDPMTYMRTYLNRRIPTIPDLVFFALAVLGMAEGLRKRDPSAIVVTTTYVYTCLFICVLVFADPRYRSATEPALLIFACAKIQDLIRQRRWPPRLWESKPREVRLDAVPEAAKLLSA
jgi:4-amino-4-deoxy-L-arabinose transferase-like glycosyltransferase